MEGKEPQMPRSQAIRTIRASVLCLVLSAMMIPSLSCRNSQSKSQRQVVVYYSVDQEIAEPILAEFEKRTGIKVLGKPDIEASKTVGLVQTIRAQAGQPVADVFWSSENFHTIRLAREGLLQSYASDATANWPARFTDSQGRWYGFALRGRAIVYSTIRVPAGEAPKKLEDLLDPRWKGRIVMGAPEFGTTGGDIASWFVHYGPQRAREILAGLKANNVRLVDGNSKVVRMIANGEADVGFTDTDDIYVGQRNGWSVAMNSLDQNGQGALAIPNTAAIIQGAPHLAEARELMAFLLSETVETMLARSDSHNTPVRASLAEQFKQYAIPRPLEVDFEKVADQLPVAIQASKETLR